MLEPLEPKVVTQDITPAESLYKAIVLPFNLERNLNFEGLKLCVVPVLIEGTKGKQAFDLLVDTGAEVTVLSEYVAKIVGVESQRSSVMGQGIGSRSQYQRGMVENIEIMQKMELDGQEIEGKISLGRSKVAIGQLSGKFSEYSILGILGAETIQEICLKIDYPKKYLEFSKVLPANQIGEVNE
jgi:predicted aspartyl protease